MDLSRFYGVGVLRGHCESVYSDPTLCDLSCKRTGLVCHSCTCLLQHSSIKMLGVTCVLPFTPQRKHPCVFLCLSPCTLPRDSAILLSSDAAGGHLQRGMFDDRERRIIPLDILHGPTGPRHGPCVADVIACVRVCGILDRTIRVETAHVCTCICLGLMIRLWALQ